MPLVVASLHVYPVKGCRGASPAAALAQPRGFAGDRCWMIVDADGLFVSQRSRPVLALVAVGMQPQSITLSAPGRSSFIAAVDPDGRPRDAAGMRTVTVWNDTVEAVDAGDSAAAWLQDVIGEPARLVHMPAAARRAVDPRYGAPGDEVSFADGYPYLLVSTASLADLNARLAKPLPMDRFRPNLVVEGCEPEAEDGWRRIRIGSVPFRLVKPCIRCAVTTIDQVTGRPDGPEPLRTLAGYRTWQDGARFGMNVIAEGEGVVRVGDHVTVLE